MKKCCFTCQLYRPLYEGAGGGECKVDGYIPSNPRKEGEDCPRFRPLFAAGGGNV